MVSDKSVQTLIERGCCNRTDSSVDINTRALNSFISVCTSARSNVFVALKILSFSNVSRYILHAGLHDSIDQVNRMERAGFRRLLIEDVALVYRAVADEDEDRGVAAPDRAADRV